MRNESSKKKVAISRARGIIRKEMDRAWRDYFEKNPDMNEEEIRRLIEERSRGKEDQKD